MAISTAVPVGAVARTVGIETKYINTNVGDLVNLPQRVALIGQGSTAAAYDTTKAQVTSASEVGAAYGFGSPLHLAALQLQPANGDGLGTVPLTVYPLEDDDVGVVSKGDITITGTAASAGALQVIINGIASSEFVVAAGDTSAELESKIVEAVNGVLSMPMSAEMGTGVVILTSKWAGASANQLSVVVSGPNGTGITFTVTQPTGGLVNPSITGALDQIGNVWETMIINCLDHEDSTVLDEFEVFGEGRWGALTRKPLVVFTGHALATPAEIVVVTDKRKTQRTNVFVPNPGSVVLPFVTAAAAVARIALVANNNPARDYARQPLSYIEPGLDGEQWTWVDRNVAVLGGASTVEVSDGVVNLSDTVTTYRPDGEENPAYRFVKDIVKLQNVIFNIDLIFNTAEWDGAPLIPDDQPTTNAAAKKPKNVISVLSALADSLGLAAIISEPAHSKGNMQCEIDDSNPNRVNAVFPVKLSGNVNVNSIDLHFGFYFGTSTVIN